MKMDRLGRGLRTYAVATGLIASMGAALLAPGTAFAEVTNKEYNGTEGTTDVTARFDRSSNVLFSVPTTIPFIVSADGSLMGPSAEEATIKNLSAFPIHVTNVKVKSQGAWTIVEDAMDSEHDAKWALIDFQIGPNASMKSAYEASQGDGIDVCNDINYVMAPKGDSSSALKLKTSGHARKISPGTVSGVARITWTVEAGSQHARA